jgi:3',5'-cyclic AMP phosphodiesterase CpdA
MRIPVNEVLRIGLISDIHLGPDRETRRGADAERLIGQFLEDMRLFAPAFIVDLGDRIMEVDEPTDRRHSVLVRDLLRRAEAPVFHLLGNHDVAHLPKREVSGLLDLPASYRSAQLNGYQCVFLDSTDPVVGEYGGHISEAQIAWIEAELTRAERPAVVFCHHPLDDQPIESNPLFQEHPEWGAVDNRATVREVLARSRKVVAVVTGHAHWNRATCVGGVPFLTIQCLVETWNTGGEPAGAYGKLWIEPKGRLRLEVMGRDRLDIVLQGSSLETLQT